MKINSISFAGQYKTHSKAQRKRQEVSSPAYRKSEEIKASVADMKEFSDAAKEKVKTQYANAKYYLKLGKACDYQGFVSCDENNKEKILFGEKDEETKLPQACTKIRYYNGTEVVMGMKFHDGLNLFSVNECYNDKDATFLSAAGKIPLHYKEHDIETGYTKETVPTEFGVTYFEGIQDKDGEIIKPFIEADIDFKHPSKSEFRETKDGITDVYRFNKSSDMWEKTE